MRILVLTQAEVEELLTIHECIPVMEKALLSLAEGESFQPLRTVMRPAGAAGLMALMPAYSGAGPLFGLKTICVFPGNPQHGKDAHQGSVTLYDGNSGELRAIMNASAITAIRTASVSAVATKLLARADATELAIIGCGVQARSHLAALSCVRSIQSVRVTSRSRDRVRAFLAEAQPHYNFSIEAVEGAKAAVRGADIIVTATNSHQPVLEGNWVRPGAHINAIGTFSPTSRELDTETIRRATLFVDRRESAENEAGDYLVPLKEGAIKSSHIKAELGEVLSGRKPGRTSPGEITVFKSLGLAVEDLAAAESIYDKAIEQQKGTWVEF